MGFSFHSFLVLKLIDCIVFHWQICLKRLISFGMISSLLLATLQDAVYFNFINRLNLFSSLSLLGLFASLVVLSAKKKICLGLLKRRFYLVKRQKKPMARPKKDDAARNCLSNPRACHGQKHAILCDWLV